tara:strand:- start:1324 stop:3033 length:1710 start_codon:yes stop_codon:yes gene_type:complete
MKLSKRRSQRIPIILFLASGMLGINSYSADLLDNSFINQTLIVNQEATSNQIPANTNKDKNSGINLSESNQEYSILNPNLLSIDGPDVSLIFKQTAAKEIFEYLAEIGNYGFVWVKNNPIDQGPENNRLITLTLKDVTYQKAFNALLLSSGLQAKLHKNILYVGPNVRNTVFTTRSSDVYQLNQISASSAADYLANLGASVTKTYTIKTSVTQGASQSQSVQGASTSSTTTDQSETSVKIYGATIGPLVGLIATTDERLRTVTMVGEKDIIDLAKVFLKRLDKKQKQVALNVRVLDVNLTDNDKFSTNWGMAFKQGSPFIIGSGGIIKSTVGQYIPQFGEPTETPGRSYTNTPENKDTSFFGYLEASIKTGTTKVLASPTLLLSESSGASGGSEIGREFGNEGYVQVGDKVVTGGSITEGGVCVPSYENVGVQLGAKVLGIDQNKNITFTMSPVVTSITSTTTIAGCGEVNLLNQRKVDTGSVRIKDGETLVLTGVIQDADVKTLQKYPLLGDLPLLGALFRSKSNESYKRELIILVTPKLINDGSPNIDDYNLRYSSKESMELIKQIE